MSRGDPLILRLIEPTAPETSPVAGQVPAEPTAPEKPPQVAVFPDAAQERGEVAAPMIRTDMDHARIASATPTERDYLGPARLIRDLSGAFRTRLYRRRRAAGKIVVRVTIDEVGAAEELIAKGWLDPRDQDDRRAIGAALERATIKIMPRVTRHDTAEPDRAHSLVNWSEDEDTCKSSGVCRKP